MDENRKFYSGINITKKTQNYLETLMSITEFPSELESKVMIKTEMTKKRIIINYNSEKDTVNGAQC